MGRRRAAALVAKAAAKTTFVLKEDARGKPRGGASHACPVCGGITEVIDTRRHEDGVRVRRVRQCVTKLKRRCHNPFTTTEKVP